MKKHKIGIWIPSKKTHALGKMEEEARQDFMKIAYKEKGWEIFDNLDFTQALINNGRVFINDFCLSDLDVYLWFSKSAGNIYNYQILKALSKNVIVINNPASYHNGLDKLNSKINLKKRNISTPDFAFLSARNIKYSYKLLDKWGTLLLKPRRGSFGIGIVKVTNKETLRDIIGYLGSHNYEGYYLEKYIDSDMSKWCGITIVNNKVLFGYRKRASKISNWKIIDIEKEGGHVVYVEPTPEQACLALGVAKATKLDITGVDIITSKDNKLYVVDVHTLPGFFPALSKKSKVRVADELINCIRNRLGQ